MKDEDANVRRDAVDTLGEIRAKEYAKDIAELLKDNDAAVRGDAVSVLGGLGAKEYADEIGKLINDLAKCYIYDEVTKEWEHTTVSAEAERVLKEWGVDVKKLKSQNK